MGMDMRGEVDAMTASRMEQFKDELRRMRENIVSAFVERAENDADEQRGSASREDSHVVPSNLTILDVMEGELATVLPESTLRPALAVMIERQISSVPVVDADGRIVGALNEGDLIRIFFDPDVECVADVMTRNPPSVSIDAPLVDVIDHLMSSNFRRVLIHENDRLVGVITRSHVMPALMDALERRAIALAGALELH
jgi:CBS domain-containing protein